VGRRHLLPYGHLRTLKQGSGSGDGGVGGGTIAIIVILLLCCCICVCVICFGIAYQKTKSKPQFVSSYYDELYPLGGRPHGNTLLDMGVGGKRKETLQFQKGVTPDDEFLADWRIDYSELTFKDELGRGGFGVVYKGVWRGANVAVKQMLQGLSAKELEDFEAEARLLQKLRPHTNVVQFQGFRYLHLFLFFSLSRSLFVFCANWFFLFC